MGMFDEIVVHRKLPIPKEFVEELKNVKWKEIVFQTKDLENCLTSYKIALNGKLYAQKFEDAGHVLAFNAFHDQRKKQNEMFWESVATPSSIVFYTDLYQTHFDYWIEFKAHFSPEGKLNDITANYFSKESNIERKKEEKERAQKEKKENARYKKLWYKIYKWLWKKPLSFFVRKFYNLTRQLPGLIMRVERRLFPW